MAAKESNTIVVAAVRPVEDANESSAGRCRSFLVCLAGIIILTFSTGCHASFGIILPQLQNEFNVGKTRAVWVGSTATAMSAIWCPLIGRLCDRFSCRTIAAFGGLTCAIGLFTTSVAPSLDVMFVTYGLIFGIGTSACIHTAYVEVARRFEKHRALATGIMSTGWSLGTLGLSPLVYFLLRNIGWVPTFRVLGGLFLANILLTFAYHQNSRKSAMKIVEKKTNGCKTLLDFSMFRNLNFTLLILGISTFPFGYYTPSFFMMEHATFLGVTSNNASLLYTWMGLSNLCARLLAGKILEHVDPIHVLRTCLFSFGVAALLFTLARTLPWILVYCILIGFIDGVCSIASAMSVVKCVGVHRYPQALGFYAFGQAITSSLAPPLASLVIDSTGHSSNAWYLLGTVTILGSLILFGIKFQEDTKMDFSEKHGVEVLLVQQVTSV